MTVDIPGEYEDFVRKAVASGMFKSSDDVICRALELLEQEQKNARPMESRQGGQWKGQVKVAEDFDELPTDLQDAFGMRGV